MQQRLQKIVEESVKVKQQMLPAALPAAEQAALALIKAFEKGNRLFLCGNGGSAADSQHIAAEFIGRFRKERRALPAIALTTDTSVLTCLPNDYSYEIIFSRQLEGLGRSGDVLWGISTSGKSGNVLRAFETAAKMGIMTVAMTGHDGGPMGRMADICMNVPATVTARIQEAHITLAHAICEIVEDHFAGPAA